MGIEPKPNTPNLNPVFGLSEPNRSTEATQRDQLTKAIRTELSGSEELPHHFIKLMVFVSVFYIAL